MKSSLPNNQAPEKHQFPNSDALERDDCVSLHFGLRKDMMRLLATEHGLRWQSEAPTPLWIHHPSHLIREFEMIDATERRSINLELGYWVFSGAWLLVIGAFLCRIIVAFPQ